MTETPTNNIARYIFKSKDSYKLYITQKEIQFLKSLDLIGFSNVTSGFFYADFRTC